MADRSDIELQYALLASHRRTLAYLLVEQSKFGVGYVPPQIWHGIDEARAAIQKIKVILRAWGDQIDDLPSDEQPTVALAPISQRAGMGLNALADLILADQARAAAIVYRASFATTSRQITILRCYKDTHDLFHQLEDCYTMLASSCKRLLSDATAWIDIETNEPELFAKITALLDYVNGSVLAEEASAWAQKLSRAQHELRIAVEAQHSEQCRSALGRLKEVIDRQMSRLNTRLVGVAATLNMAALVETLQTICQQIDRPDLPADIRQRLEDFRQGLTALAELKEQFTKFVQLHENFQDLDDELRRIYGLLVTDTSELANAWPDLSPMSQQLCSGRTDMWSIRLDALATDVTSALAVDDVVKQRRTFARYHNHAVVTFNRIDHDLRDLCNRLQQVGTSLDRVLQVLQ